MKNVATPLLGLLLLAAAGWVGWKIVLPQLQKPAQSGESPLPSAEVAGLPADFVSRIETLEEPRIISGGVAELRGGGALIVANAQPTTKAE